MNKFLTIAALITAAFAAQTAQAAAVYNYNYAFSNGTVVNGSFTGTAAGNLVTDLSNITAYINGQAFNGSGNLYASSMSLSTYGYMWKSGGGVASFDGLQNNFLFMDADYPNTSNFTNYFHDVSVPQRELYAYTRNGSAAGYNYNYSTGRVTAGVWTMTAVAPVAPAAPIPEPTSVLLLGIGIAGLLAARRKKSA